MKAHPLLAELELPLDDRGCVLVDELLRVLGCERIWALGDAAAVPNTRTPAHVDPPTCQHALRQARRLAKNLQGDPQPYGYGCLARSRRSGATEVSRTSSASASAASRWFVTGSYHPVQLPLTSRKLRVVADWTTSLFFRRDIAELSMLGHPHRLGRPDEE